MLFSADSKPNSLRAHAILLALVLCLPAFGLDPCRRFKDLIDQTSRPNQEKFLLQHYGPSHTAERRKRVQREEELEIQARAQKKNRTRFLQLKEQLLELYLSNGQPMEAIWTLNGMGRRDEGDALEALVRRHMMNSFADFSPSRETPFVIGGAGRNHSLYQLPGDVKVIFKLANPETPSIRVNHQAEIAAYGIDRVLKTDVVPIVLGAANPEGEWGSLHLFVESDGRVHYNNDQQAVRLDRVNLVHELLRTFDSYQWIRRPGNYAVAIDFGAAFGIPIDKHDFSIQDPVLRDRILNTSYSQFRERLRESFSLPTQLAFWFHYRKLIRDVKEKNQQTMRRPKLLK